MKTCGLCGTSYTLAQFRELELRGFIDFEDGIDRVELRQCSKPCDNTLAIDVDRNGKPIQAVQA